MVRLRHHFSEGLDATVQSLIAQLYPDWELHLLASAPLDDHLRERLQACTCRDGRIRLTLVQDEAQAAPNTVAPELTGDWVGVLAPGDVLARHAPPSDRGPRLDPPAPAPGLLGRGRHGCGRSAI